MSVTLDEMLASGELIKVTRIRDNGKHGAYLIESWYWQGQFYSRAVLVRKKHWSNEEIKDFIEIEYWNEF